MNVWRVLCQLFCLNVVPAHVFALLSLTLTATAGLPRSHIVCEAAGVLTTWKKGILLRGGPRTRRFALYKALMECGLFAYMTPFIFTVCYWFLTTPNVSIWIRATKCVMELPSIIFQFTWAAACLKYWHMLVEDGTMPSALVHVTTVQNQCIN